MTNFLIAVGESTAKAVLRQEERRSAPPPILLAPDE